MNKFIRYFIFNAFLFSSVMYLASCTSGRNMVTKTMNYYNAGLYDKAIAAGKKATAINADDPMGWYWLAHSLLAKVQKTEAYNAFFS